MGCSWRKATTMSSEGIDGVMGWKALKTRRYSSILPKIKHQRRQVVKESPHEWWEHGTHEACENSS